MSPHHFTKTTVQAEVFCPKCMKLTPWRIVDGRRQYCLVCYDKPPQPSTAKPPESTQMNFWKEGNK